MNNIILIKKRQETRWNDCVISLVIKERRENNNNECMDMKKLRYSFVSAT